MIHCYRTDVFQTKVQNKSLQHSTHQLLKKSLEVKDPFQSTLEVDTNMSQRLMRWVQWSLCFLPQAYINQNHSIWFHRCERGCFRVWDRNEWFCSFNHWDITVRWVFMKWSTWLLFQEVTYAISDTCIDQVHYKVQEQYKNYYCQFQQYHITSLFMDDWVHDEFDLLLKHA